MLDQLIKIHNKQFNQKDNEGFIVESLEFDNSVRFVIFGNEMAITTKNDGVLTGNMGQLEKLFKEALSIIENYSGGHVMTLTERLNDYKTRNKLSRAKLSEITGISDPTIRKILNGTIEPNGATIHKFVDRLGPEFEEYLVFKTCYCGKKFVQMTYNQDCCSAECSLKYKGNSRGKREKVQISKSKPVSLGVYNEKARSAGLSYGQLQGMERLA